jgi:hypothetical protein
MRHWLRLHGRRRLCIPSPSPEWLCCVWFFATDGSPNILLDCHVKTALEQRRDPSFVVWRVQLGYSVYRRIQNYYSGEEDAFGVSHTDPHG